MNSKMTTNSQVSTTEPKKQKLSKQNRNRITEMEIPWRVISREGRECGKKVQGISTIGKHKIDREKLGTV